MQNFALRILFLCVATILFCTGCVDDTVEYEPNTPVNTCGDGIIDDGEECDDAGESDTCNANCTLATCGDGIVNTSAGEHCDDGENNGTPNHCDVDCIYITQPVCGNGVVEEGDEFDTPEFCDDGEDNGKPNHCNQWCTAMTPPTCGNGVIEAGEQCDDAGESAACNVDCTHTQCGDGYVNENAGEICDDGEDNGKGGHCNRDCTAIEHCGNGIVDDGEVCDDGENNGELGYCNTSCSGTGDAICGNGIIEDGEQCDDEGESDTCNANCTTSTCGDGFVNYTAGEECDDGGDSFSCTADCKAKDVAFRLDTVEFIDPHLFYSLLGCNDITNSVPLGLFPGGANGMLQEGLDRTNNGKFNNSLALILRPLIQKHANESPLDFAFPHCDSPLGECTQDNSKPVIMSRAHNQKNGYCLPISEQKGRNPNYTGLHKPTGPCFASENMDIEISIRGITLSLIDARITATYKDRPATRLTNGILVGFLSVEAAQAAIVPVPDPIGDTPLYDFLKGGGACGAGDDSDENNGEKGWWFYLNFTAEAAEAWNE